LRITVPCIRRFGVPDEETAEQFQGTPKCGGRNRTKGGSPTAVSGARAAEGGEAYTRCYAKLSDKNILEKLKLSWAGVVKLMGNKLLHVLRWVDEDENGKRQNKNGAISGNKVYAHLREGDVNAAMDRIGFSKRDTLFLTPTLRYKKTWLGRAISWLEMQVKVPMLLRKLKRMGMVGFVWVNEAHFDGGCHRHIVTKWDREFNAFLYNGKLEITDRELVDFIKANWDGRIDIQRTQDENVKGYMKKYLGKYGHCEDAIKRARRNWEKEGDKKHKNADVKNIWTYFYTTVLRVRQWGESRATPEQKEERRRAEVMEKENRDALLANINNSTEGKSPKVIKRVFLPRWLIEHPDYDMYCGEIKPNTEMWNLTDEYIKGKYTVVYEYGAVEKIIIGGKTWERGKGWRENGEKSRKEDGT